MADTTPDKIGWLFIQEYYSRLNSDPLHLYQFYTKQSTLIHGYEGESAQVAKGQQQVQNRVKQQKLFQGCTVLVSSVDCLGSLEGGIVILVTGEMDNVAGRNVKFAQTFVLAPSDTQKGYYVLNDILRFMCENEDKDEEDEPQGEAKVESREEPQVESKEPQAQHATQHATQHANLHADLHIPIPVAVTVPKEQDKAQPTAAAPKAPTENTSSTGSSAVSALAPERKIYYSAYLKNVVPEVDQRALRQALEKAGQVTHLQIETDKSRAFVDFVDQKSLDRALEMQIIRVGTLNVVVEPRKRRKPVGRSF